MVRVVAGAMPCLEMFSCAKLRTGCATKAIALNTLGVSFLVPEAVCEIFARFFAWLEVLRTAGAAKQQLMHSPKKKQSGGVRCEQMSHH